MKRHSGKSSTQSIKKRKTRARGPYRAKPRVAATKRTRSASDEKLSTPQRSKKQRFGNLSSPSSSDESRSSSDAESATSSSTTSYRFRHSTSSPTDERESRGKHDKHKYARTSQAEKRAPGNKYGRHHNEWTRHHRSRTTPSSSSSSEDDNTYHKSSRHVYGRLPATHSVPAKKQLKQIRHGEYVDFNVLVAHAGSSLTPNTKSSPGLRINSLPKWFQAWNQFLFTNAVFHPDAVPALLIYQATTLTIVVYYDAAVRTRIANNPDMHWDE